jgi:chemotaxis protein methyltransferase CheR
MEPKVYSQVKSSIKHALKIDLENYKDEQMKRRLDSWLARSKVDTWQDYFCLISADATELERFRNYLTINVTDFFRDQPRWDSLRQEILPYLIQHSLENGRFAGLKLWSAGCSIGTEAYSLALMMAESTPHQNYDLLATDIHRGALLKARTGGPYSEDDLRNLSAAQRQKYISPVAPFYVREGLKKNIRFEEQDLLAAPFEKDFDLIVCRNVVIYFTAAAKEKLYAKFYEALRPGGVLFVGGTEIISGSTKYGFQNFGISFYRKMTGIR